LSDLKVITEKLITEMICWTENIESVRFWAK